jgi:predicted DNA-binding protein (UPF0251 family)
MVAYSKQPNALKRRSKVPVLLGQRWPRPTRLQLALRGRVVYRLDPRTLQEVVGAYGSGMSGDQVAEKYGISRHTVLKLVRASGGTVRRQRLTVEEKRTILELDGIGLGQGEIARRVQRSQSLVWHFLNGQWPNLNA